MNKAERRKQLFADVELWQSRCDRLSAIGSYGAAYHCMGCVESLLMYAAAVGDITEEEMEKLYPVPLTEEADNETA